MEEIDDLHDWVLVQDNNIRIMILEDQTANSDSENLHSDDENDERGIDSENPSFLSDDSLPNSSDSLEMREIAADAKKEKIWWELPVGILKFCVFGMRSVWYASIAAAAVFGIVVLLRKLCRMKHWRGRMRLKLAIDDKKASQFVNRSTHFNEAFSVVRRVPIVRPSLQAGSATQWAAPTLR